MKQEELILENRCRSYARANGWVAVKLEKNGNKGIPDDLFISPDGGRVMLIEFKKNSRQKLRPEQVHWQERYPKLVFRIDNELSFKELIDKTAIESSI